MSAPNFFRTARPRYQARLYAYMQQYLDRTICDPDQDMIQHSLDSYIGSLEILLRHAKEIQSASLFDESLLTGDTIGALENLSEWDQRT